jgi:hypothetical protein
MANSNTAARNLKNKPSTAFYWFAVLLLSREVQGSILAAVTANID